MADVLPKPTKGSGILRFSEDIYLELKYDLNIEEPADAISCSLYAGDLEIPLVPQLIAQKGDIKNG